MRDNALVRKAGGFKNILIAILSILLAVSLVINAITYVELSKYYRLLYTSILDPLGLSYFQDETIDPPTDANIVIFFGDSRAANWIAPQVEGYSFTNRGIGNQTSAQILLRFEEHVLPLKPDILVLQVCINDLKTIPLFPDQKQEIIADCEANIESIVQKSLELDAVVILTTVFPTSGNVPLARQLVWSDDVYEAIDEVNEFILTYEADHVIIFDTKNTLATSDGNIKPEYVHDLLHLNVNGYHALNLELTKILEDLK